MLTLKSKQPPQTWRVMEAPGRALSAGKYSARRDWHALSESESPGPPDGPGEYCYRMDSENIMFWANCNKVEMEIIRKVNDNESQTCHIQVKFL